MQRVQVLIQTKQQKALADLARQEGKSISALIREMIDQGLEEKSRQREDWRSTMAELRRIREEIAASYGVYKGDIVAEVRAEREADIARVWRGES